MDAVTVQYNQEVITYTTIIIDAFIKKPIGKKQLFKLLKSNCAKTDAVNNLKTAVEDVISFLRKAKIDIPSFRR